MTEFGTNEYACSICIHAYMTIFKIRLFIIIVVVLIKKNIMENFGFSFNA